MNELVLAAGLGERFRDVAGDGPLLLAIPVAAIAGLVSFLSPCVLPLVPGYLSYMTGLSGADMEAEAEEPGHSTRRVLLGGALFVLGFSAVFVSFGALFGHVGNELVLHQVALNRVFGVLTIVFGLLFMGVFSRFAVANREFRVHRLPAAGLAGAPFLGVVFGVGWTPCIGPTLGAVLTLSASQASAGRGALLTVFYCLGLGVPFVLTGLAFRRSMKLFAVVRRHQAVVTRVGGAFLVAIGVLLLTGVWADVVAHLQNYVDGYTTGL